MLKSRSSDRRECAGCGEPDLVALNTSQLDGPKLDISELAGAAGAMPFLADRRLVIVRGYLARTEPRDVDAPGVCN
jgi:hypothetical protein